MAMKAAGLSYKAIAVALGRNDSLIGQIARGAKPGANLEAAAGELRRRVEANGWKMPAPAPLPSAPRRAQRVRQAVRHGGSRWATASTKDQATRSGAHALDAMVQDAAATGRRLALNLAVSPNLVVARSGGKRVKPKGRRQYQELRAGDGGRGIDAATLAALVDAHGGNVTEAIAEYLAVSGYVGSIAASDIQRIEISSWDA